MKLALTAKCISGKNYIRRGIYLLTILICFDIQAQTYQIKFENIRLSDALVEISKQFGINIAFDAEKLGSVTISKEVTGNTPNEVLNNLLLNTGFEYLFKHDSYLITEVIPVTKDMEIKKFQIIGTILDKENGEQLPFASINIPETNSYTSSTSNGSFYINYTAANKAVHLNISYIGYSVIDTILNLNQPSITCEFKLKRKSFEMKTVEVRENKLEMIDYRNDVDFATTINPSKLSDLPVLAETDIFKALQLLPGISYSENSSELNIRGGSSDQNLILFDGQTLYNLSHYFGVFSSLNPNVIKDIQVYKGGYDSRYGERVSGIIDITTKSGNQLKSTVYGDINLLSGNIAAEIPISKKFTLLAAGRRSYSDIYATEFSKNLFNKTYIPYKDSGSAVTETTPLFNFYDYNLKLTYRLSNYEDIAISMFNGKDHYNNSYTTSNDKMEGYVNEVNNWGNYGYSALWMKQWNGAFFSNFQAGVSGYKNEYSDSTELHLTQPMDTNQRYLPNPNNIFKTYNNNKLSDVSFSARNILYLGGNHQINFGTLIHHNSIYYHKDADKVYIYDNTTQKAWNLSVYGQDKIHIKKLTIKPGFRLSFYEGNNNFYFEPRFAVNYKISEKMSARFATGRFNQFISQVLTLRETGYNKNFWVLTNDTTNPVIKSNHFIFGISFKFGNFLLDAETYYKDYSGLQEYFFISPFQREGDFPNYFQPNKSKKQGTPPPPPQYPNNSNRPSYFIQGTGISEGIDVSLHYKLKIFNSWVSYSIGKSTQRFPDINQNSEFPAYTDQTHQLSWANMLTIKKWNIGTITLFSTGRPYFNDSIPKNTLPIIRTYSRAPNYFRNDFTVNYNFVFNKIRLKTGITLINLFNTNNYFDINSRKFDFESISFSETNLIRAQNLSLNLFVHFVF